jgi:hypothetical protein
LGKLLIGRRGVLSTRTFVTLCFRTGGEELSLRVRQRMGPYRVVSVR